jgi:GrpB-like predicted nucleotidyltransferase (UPF0157 family)
MIGLQHGIVLVVPHCTDWLILFDQERAVLHDRIGQYVVDIQHVGSTAVPGLVAKPIIDIAVAIDSPVLVAQCQESLCDLGSRYRGDSGSEGGHLFVKESSPQVRTHHLHVVTMDDPQWRNYLLFRDRLNGNATLRTQYSELKKSLQAEFPNDRHAYTKAKEDFIRTVLSGHQVRNE